MVFLFNMCLISRTDISSSLGENRSNGNLRLKCQGLDVKRKMGFWFLQEPLLELELQLESANAETCCAFTYIFR